MERGGEGRGVWKLLGGKEAEKKGKERRANRGRGQIRAHAFHKQACSRPTNDMAIRNRTFQTNASPDVTGVVARGTRMDAFPKTRFEMRGSTAKKWTPRRGVSEGRRE